MPVVRACRLQARDHLKSSVAGSSPRVKKVFPRSTPPGMRRPLLALIGMSALAACRSKPPDPPPPPALPPAAEAPAPGVRVSLVWSTPVDLDLYVTDPSQETVYFANPNAQSGGKL